MALLQQRTLRVTLDFPLTIDDQTLEIPPHANFDAEEVQQHLEKLFSALLKEDNRLQKVIVSLIAESLNGKAGEDWQEMLFGDVESPVGALLPTIQTLDDETQKAIKEMFFDDPRATFLFTEPFWKCFRLPLPTVSLHFVSEERFQ